MLVSFIKFFHLLFALGLLGLALFCCVLVGSKQSVKTHQPLLTVFNKILLVLSLLAMITGTFLVYPKNFTFHTPWIQAAYFLLIIFSIGILSLILFKNKIQNRIILRISYLISVIILAVIAHDAVTKTTILIIPPASIESANHNPTT